MHATSWSLTNFVFIFMKYKESIKSARDGYTRGGLDDPKEFTNIEDHQAYEGYME